MQILLANTKIMFDKADRAAVDGSRREDLEAVEF